MTTPRTRKANAPAMDNAPEPQDHKSPAQREADGDREMELEFDGKTYIVASSMEYTKGVARAMDQRLGTVMVEKLLGPEQYAKFVATDPFDGDYGRLVKAWIEATGFGDEGN